MNKFKEKKERKRNRQGVGEAVLGQWFPQDQLGTLSSARGSNAGSHHTVSSPKRKMRQNRRRSPTTKAGHSRRRSYSHRMKIESDAESSASVHRCQMESRRQSFGWSRKRIALLLCQAQGNTCLEKSVSLPGRIWWGGTHQYSILQGRGCWQDQGVCKACTHLISGGRSPNLDELLRSL